MKNIRLEVLDDGVGIAYMDMPGLPFNIFSEAMMDDCDALIDSAIAQNLNGLVLASAKGAFAAGADLGMIQDFANMRFHADDATMKNRFSRLGRIFRRLEQLPMPTVAAINGLALGGGLEVALACHARVCVRSESPFLGLPEIQLGLLPGAGGTQRLPRVVGLEAATRMLLNGNPVNAEQALAIGLVDAVCDAHDLLPRALEAVRHIPAGARWDQPDWTPPADDIARCASADWPQTALGWVGLTERDQLLYPAVNCIINCLGQGLPLDIDSGFQREWNIFVGLMKDPVVANMVVTCFLNKTSAPKLAVQQAGKAAVASYAWLASVDAPKSLARKLDTVAPERADIVVSDTADAQLVQLQSALTASAAPAFIRYCGTFKRTAAVEVFAGADLLAKTVALMQAAQKIPVIVNRPEGVLSPILTHLQQQFCEGGDASLLAAAQRVELDAAVRLVAPQAEFGPFTASESALAQGLNLLTELALIAFAQLQTGVISDPQALDVLMVYGLHFPEWTGGPIAFLAMAQRREFDVELLAPHLQAAIAAIDYDLKQQAAYVLSD